MELLWGAGWVGNCYRVGKELLRVLVGNCYKVGRALLCKQVGCRTVTG